MKRHRHPRPTTSTTSTAIQCTIDNTHNENSACGLCNHPLVVSGGGKYFIVCFVLLLRVLLVTTLMLMMGESSTISVVGVRGPRGSGIEDKDGKGGQ